MSEDLEEYVCKDCMFDLLPLMDEKFEEWRLKTCPEQVVLMMCEHAEYEIAEMGKHYHLQKVKCRCKLKKKVKPLEGIPSGKLDIMVGKSSYCEHRWIVMYSSEGYEKSPEYRDLVESVKNKNAIWAVQYLQSESKSWKHIAYAIVKGLIK